LNVLPWFISDNRSVLLHFSASGLQLLVGKDGTMALR